jgi:hypothetical protein
MTGCDNRADTPFREWLRRRRNHVIQPSRVRRRQRPRSRPLVAAPAAAAQLRGECGHAAQRAAVPGEWAPRARSGVGAGAAVVACAACAVGALRDSGGVRRGHGGGAAAVQLHSGGASLHE